MEYGAVGADGLSDIVPASKSPSLRAQRGNPEVEACEQAVSVGSSNAHSIVGKDKTVSSCILSSSSVNPVILRESGGSIRKIFQTYRVPHR